MCSLMGMCESCGLPYHLPGESNSFIVDVANPVKSTEPTAAVTTKEVMSTWAKYTSGGVSLPTQSTSGIQSKLSTTSLPSIAKSVGSIKSNASLPESIASIDFKGFSLVEVLHSISSLEDQLSFFAPKVKEYYKLVSKLFNNAHGMPRFFHNNQPM